MVSNIHIDSPISGTRFHSSENLLNPQEQGKKAWEVALEVLEKAIQKADILEEMIVPSKEMLKAAYMAKIQLIKPQLSLYQKIWNFVSLIIKKIAVFFKLLDTSLDKEESVCLDEDSKRVVEIVKKWNQPDFNLEEIENIFKDVYSTFEEADKLDPDSDNKKEWTGPVMKKIAIANEKIQAYKPIRGDTICGQYIIELNK